MAATVTEDFTNLTLAENATNWAAFKIAGTGGTPTVVADADVFIQGNQAVSIQVNKQRDWLYFDQATASAALDFTSGGAEFGQLVYIWCNFLAVGLLTNRSVGGIALAMGHTTTDFFEWYVDGKDTYPGGWVRYVLDPQKPPSAVTGTPNLNNIGFVGMIADVGAATARFTNLIVDRIDVGNKLTITGTSSDPDSSANDVWQDIVDVDEGDTTKKFGIVTTKAGIIYVRGRIDMGDVTAATNSTLEARDQVIVWENPTYYLDAANTDASTIDDSSWALNIIGGTGTNSWNDGVIVGSGDTAKGRNGCTYLSDGPTVTVDLDDGNVNTVNVYGATFRGLGTITAGTNTAHDFIGNTIDQCRKVDTGQVEVRNCTVSGTLDKRALDDAVADDGTVLTTETTAANNATIDDITLLPTVPVAADAYYFGSDIQFDGVRIDISTMGVGTWALTWEYWNGSTWSALTIGTDGVNDFMSPGAVEIDWTVPGDWATTSVNSLTHFWVRARLSSFTSVTTAPIGRQAWTLNNGSAMFWGDSIDIKNSAFIANTNAATTNVSAIEHDNDAGASDTYDNLTFSGNDADVLNTDDGESNTFTVTPGTDRVDVTSHPYSVDDRVSVITTVTLPAGLVADTGYYVINTTANDFQLSLTASPGAAVDITDNGTGTHTIRKALVIDTTNGADPGSELNTMDSDVVINAAVTLTVTVKDSSGSPVDGARVRIEEDPAKTTITDGTTNGSGVFTDTFNFGGDQDVKIIVRLKGFQNFTTLGTIQSDGISVPVTLITDSIVNLP